jgi:glycosyltransferase involved in cell wall biosynthesis
VAGLDHKVFFIGQRPENQVGAYFRASDIFSLTSREDPFPLVNLEAMSYGLPIVAFREAGGAQEALLPDAGIVVPYLDTTAMAEAIVSLIRDESLRQRLGRKAAEKCKTHYQWSRYVSDFVLLMEKEFGYSRAKKEQLISTENLF